MTSAAELLDLLAVERQKLLSGDLDGALRLAPLKEELASRLKTTADLELIAADLRRNGKLFAAAAEGVASALHLLSDARDGGEASHTYAADGRRRTMRARGRLSRKL